MVCIWWLCMDRWCSKTLDCGYGGQQRSGSRDRYGPQWVPPNVISNHHGYWHFCEHLFRDTGNIRIQFWAFRFNSRHHGFRKSYLTVGKCTPTTLVPHRDHADAVTVRDCQDMTEIHIIDLHENILNWTMFFWDRYTELGTTVIPYEGANKVLNSPKTDWNLLVSQCPILTCFP